MNDIRAKFEEIWPVPDVIFWSQDIGRYAPMPDEVLQYERLNEQWAHEHNARLDTFTRCQETMAPVLSIVDELVRSLGTLADECLASYFNEHWESYTDCCNLVCRAKQIIGREK